MLRADALRWATTRLHEAGVESPRLEARLLLAHVLGLTQTALIADPDGPVPEAAYDAVLRRREAREPLALITGNREFWSLSFAVSPDTLIPRPDSETIVEVALARVDRRRPGRVLDLGTGTGCLLLSVLHDWPLAWGLGVDRIAAAAGLARRNAAAVGLADRAAFVCADWAAPLAGRFELVLANPPYIRSADIGALMPDVARFEPRSALDGGADGLDAYRALIPGLPGLLTATGIAVLEIGIGQALPVTALAERNGFHVSTEADLGGIIRAIILKPAR